MRYIRENNEEKAHQKRRRHLNNSRKEAQGGMDWQNRMQTSKAGKNDRKRQKDYG